MLVARQPILDRDAVVVAYELLARRDLTSVSWSGGADDVRTTERVVGQAFLDMDVWGITEGLPAFVNFGRDLLLDGTVEGLPAELTVVEILETVDPDDEVVRACRRLRDLGYRLALDDVVAGDPRLVLLDTVDVVKIDYATTTPQERVRLFACCRHAGAQVLAEKVERRDQHDEALAMGCDLFQGYFFQKPSLVAGRRPAGERRLHLQLLRSVTGSRIDRDAIGNLLARNPDVAARFRDLWTVVMPDAPLPATVRTALGGLQRADLVKLATLLVVTWLGEHHPRPLLDTTLIRARFCELLIMRGARAGAPLDGYLVGLCSLLDALVGEPLDDVLARIHPSSRLLDACLRDAGALGSVLSLVRGYEHAEWSTVRACCSALSIDGGALGPLYLECLAWSRTMLRRARAVDRGDAW